MVVEPRVLQFSSEIILVISNRPRAGRFHFEIMRMISAQIALHSVQLPLFINLPKVFISFSACGYDSSDNSEK